MPALNTLHFFLGAHTPGGYVSRIHQLEDGEEGRRIILKGGPGTGKSTLIGQVAERVEADRVELLHCAASPGAYDGVLLQTGDRRVAVLDGTPPHAIEPRVPGVCESLVDLGSGLDEEVLSEHRAEILELVRREQELGGRVHHFLAAAGALLGDTARLALHAVETDKLERFIERVCRRELRRGSGAVERVRFLTAVTADGVVLAGDPHAVLCDRLHFIEDEYGAVSRLLLAGIRRRALAAGYEVITCFCPLAPFDKIDHLFIPEARLGFMTRSRHLPELPSELRQINSRRFMKMETLGLRRQRVSFNRRAVTELLHESERLFGEAAAVHARMEAYYHDAMDYTQAGRMTDQVVERVRRLLKTAG